MAIVAATATPDKKDKKVNLEYLRKKHAEKVKGVFHFNETPGGTIAFNFREFKGDPLEVYTFTDGCYYEIPLGVARHLNKNCWWPIYTYAKNESGTATQKITTKVRRCSFEPLQFLDTEDLTPDGLSAEPQLSIAENI